ncbi:TPA: hypothetical protein ACGUOS_004401 [Vibrio vulnificus]|nr:hypothetical protein [Vibrio vulnificus]
MKNTELEDDINNLYKQVEKYTAFKWRLYRRNYWTNVILIVVSIVVSVLVTVVGLCGKSELSPFLSALLTIIISLQAAFNFSERADFYLNIHTEAKALRDNVKYKVKSQDDLFDSVDALGALRKKASVELPKGKGMKAIKT